jgi:hypothetical protein
MDTAALRLSMVAQAPRKIVRTAISNNCIQTSSVTLLTGLKARFFYNYRTGCLIALQSKIQGARGVTTEDFVPVGIGEIELSHLTYRLEVAHRHRIVRADDDPVCTDNLHEIL